MQQLQARYLEEIRPALMEELGYGNIMEVPTVQKIVLNVGAGEALDNPKALDFIVKDLTTITGQRPVITRSTKNIANFKLRAGRAVGVKVTLRKDRMWAFLDRFCNIALPRQRDFRGLPAAFDGHGNVTIGLREQLIFPEIDYDEIDKVRGMEISIVTSATTDEEGRRLLQLLGVPFRQAG
jgi:large subunit ribosomal protein L5